VVPPRFNLVSPASLGLATALLGRVQPERGTRRLESAIPAKSGTSGNPTLNWFIVNGFVVRNVAR
jgi:NADH:ubiquinone oxidoreductase subunit F (NADH-binding)